MISVVPYSSEHKKGVLAALKRNYPGMTECTDAHLYEWLTPLIEYHWNDDPDISEVPYKYGAVLLDGSKVAGFFGTIYSYRIVNGKKYLCLNFSTWCADVKYRMHTFGAVKKLCATADIITDFTPNAPSREIETQMFGFRYTDNKCFVFRPVPMISRRKANLRFINDPSELKDPEQSAIFADHQKYGLKCAEFEKDGGKGCIFYCVRTRRRWKHIPWIRFMRVVKIFNSRLFTDNLREIVFRLQKHEGFLVNVSVDSSFIDGEFSHPLYAEKKAHRIMKAKEGISFKPDLLYSELAILNI